MVHWDQVGRAPEGTWNDFKTKTRTVSIEAGELEVPKEKKTTNTRSERDTRFKQTQTMDISTKKLYEISNLSCESSMEVTHTIYQNL